MTQATPIKYGKVLVIEDSPTARETLQRVLQTRGINADYAADLQTAQAYLAQPDYDAVITDLFFPQEAGTGKRDSGRAILEEMLQEDEEGKRFQRKLAAGMAMLDKFLTPADKNRFGANMVRAYCTDEEPFLGIRDDLEEHARWEISRYGIPNGRDYEARKIELSTLPEQEVNDLIRKMYLCYLVRFVVVKNESNPHEHLRDIAQNLKSKDELLLGPLPQTIECSELREGRFIVEYQEVKENDFQAFCEYAGRGAIDYYQAMRDALEEKEENQPNGLVIAKLLQERKIPYVLATSVYHHSVLGHKPCEFFHGKYSSRWGDSETDRKYGAWEDCDSPKGKTTEKFWQKVLSSLDRIVSEFHQEKQMEDS